MGIRGLRGEDDRAPLGDPALLRSEQHFRRLLEKLPVAAYTCDTDGLISYYNSAAVRLWGRAPKLHDVTDRYCGSFRLFAPDGAPIAHERCWMALALQNNREYNGYEIVIEHPDGERSTALAYANPIHDDHGRMLGAVNVLVDISERKEAERTLERAHNDLERRVRERTADLESLNRELESFNYSVSHDLRAPLRAISGFSRAVEEDYRDALDEQGRHYLERIRLGAQQMGNLIDSLLDLSRLSRIEMTRQPVDMSTLATEVADTLSEADRERDVVFAIDDGLVAWGDPTLLRIVLENLLGNAWKFTRHRDGARIEFGAEASGASTVFVVRDNGAGFEMDRAGGLFTAFQRLHSRDEFEGLGIGLATVRRVIRRHGGQVWAEGVPDGGATFRFTLTDPSA